MCVFCEIIKGNIPSKKIYEDDDAIAILDMSQTTYGHTLVMPKKHYENILVCDKDILNKLINVTQDLANKIKTNLEANGINLLINTGASAGQTVEHLHIHIIPRYTNEDTVKFEFKENKYDLDEVLNKINA